tara:strand:- start:28359 stop:28538 length:180 start_codon:yes stop_codon:yes gene_type:complete
MAMSTGKLKRVVVWLVAGLLADRLLLKKHLLLLFIIFVGGYIGRTQAFSCMHYGGVKLY